MNNTHTSRKIVKLAAAGSALVILAIVLIVTLGHGTGPNYTPSAVLAANGYQSNGALTSAFDQGAGSADGQYFSSDSAGLNSSGDGEIVVALTPAAQSENLAPQVQSALNSSFPGATATTYGPDLVVNIPAGDL